MSSDVNLSDCGQISRSMGMLKQCFIQFQVCNLLVGNGGEERRNEEGGCKLEHE